MVESNNNLKAVILYRVSTDRQDESLQVNICQGFCKNHNMDIVEEYREIDVSGFKTPLARRYELLKILNRAETKKDFDVLVVYLHDRLGRREDETPQVVQNLFKTPKKAIEATIFQLESLAWEVEEPPYMRFAAAFSDGKRLYAVRYASDKFAPTVYYRKSERLGGYAVVSEPLESDQDDWTTVPAGTFMEIEGDQIITSDLLPNRCC